VNPPASDASGKAIIAFYAAHQADQRAATVLLAFAFIFVLFFAGSLRDYLRSTPAGESLASIALAGAAVLLVGQTVGGGLTLTAPFPSRAHDMVGLAVAAARNGSHFERAQMTAGIPAAGETTVELTYLAQIGSWLSVQPDAQYVIHPSGTRLLRNATVLGLRVAISH